MEGVEFLSQTFFQDVFLGHNPFLVHFKDGRHALLLFQEYMADFIKHFIKCSRYEKKSCY